jgi:hypothetical protein
VVAARQASAQCGARPSDRRRCHSSLTVVAVFA